LLIEILVNGETKQISEGLTIEQFVNSLELASQRLAVEYNRRILKRDNWHHQLISAGDRIEIVHFVGGGVE
jgi:sulfur carrier protein